MLEDRLSALALLHIHQDISVSVDEIIDRFARLSPHRLAYLQRLECNIEYSDPCTIQAGFLVIIITGTSSLVSVIVRVSYFLAYCS